MRLVPVRGRMKGPEGWCPPEPYVTVDDAEATKLIASKIAVEYIDAASMDAPKAPKVTAVVPETPAPAAPITPVTPPAPPPPTETDPEREQHIAEAIDLLEEGHFETGGDRAGKPKIEAVAEITGFAVTAEEVDAAVAAQAA